MASKTFDPSDSALIASLHVLSAKSPKLVKSSVYDAPADASIQVRSWKMNEFKYYDIPSPFPTLARGLFTREIVADGAEGNEGETGVKEKKYQIVVRGYDKFFNIGEVPWTTWASLEEHTTPPYTLSLKSNGCIIFIAALTPTKMLVTSKHSLGPVSNASMSHAQAGEMWLRKYLEKVGKKEEDLAGVLWEKNWTAIAELCDDSFEEHVLGYPPDKTGLHLHGLNVRTKAFQTEPTSVVDAFAEEWGFIVTQTKTLDSIKEVRAFTDACAETGEWNGESVEGFVVRTVVTEPPTSGRVDNKGKGREETAPGSSYNARSPYEAGSSFFFKVKFDEPYMMYRDWREVTKSLLSAKGKGATLSASTLPKSKMRRPETKVYVKWVIEEIKKNPEAFKEYTKGKGIIKTREAFLEWLASENGEKDLEAVRKEDVGVVKTTTTGEFGKTIIVPVAIPGCGKTAVSVALVHLFGFGHTQSDDVHVKKAAPVFIKNVTKLLETHNVVIADKNNHLKQHRQQLRDATSRIYPPVRLLALHWALDAHPPSTIHRICGDRVQSRGLNHQTLRASADPKVGKLHEDVIWQFINNTEELADEEVDEVVEMSVEEDLEAAVRRAVKGVVSALGLEEEPSEEAIEEALEVVQGYKPTKKKPDDKGVTRKSARYYGLLPEVDLVALLDARLAVSDVDEDTRSAWEALKAAKRVAGRPHVTIVHRNAIDDDVERRLWDRCSALDQMNGVPPTFKGTLGNVLWNGRVMAVTVDDFGLEASAPPAEGEVQGQEGAEFVSKLPGDIRDRLHVTVGTQAPDILPIEAMTMVKDWKAGVIAEGVKVFALDGVIVKGRVKGLFG